MKNKTNTCVENRQALTVPYQKHMVCYNRFPDIIFKHAETLVNKQHKKVT